MNRIISAIIFLLLSVSLQSQVNVDTKNFHAANGATVLVKQNTLSVTWPVNSNEQARIIFSLQPGEPLFSSIQSIKNKKVYEVARDADPGFILTIGKRDLVSQNGWNIFFDKVPLKPHQSYNVELDKKSASVRTEGSHTVVEIGQLQAADFSGMLEISLYNGSPLFNIAAVMRTATDSMAIVYDAGITSRKKIWDTIAFADVTDHLQTRPCNISNSSINQAVKYRAIFGINASGSLAVFPAPHQYFYPLDEAFNLQFTWYGNRYNNMLDGYGLGIRQDLNGDKRYVPWFNAPPNTKQRLNFFCYISTDKGKLALQKVKAFTPNDSYLPLEGYKTMASHFHNEHIMKVVLAGKPNPDTPNFVKVFKATGINIVHLAEFHYTAHPKGPDQQRLEELKALFQECKRLSSGDFLLLPGEEPNEFLGGHWLSFFPKPVYWIMARNAAQPFVVDDAALGKVYRIANADEMLQLLEKENGLVWTAHPRTKGSVGFPDNYKNERFFLSNHFLGAAWKAMPADLSQPRLGKRVLDLMDDMNNWGLKKKVLSEADLFSIEPENEMYAHLNVNYLQLKNIPAYNNGWQPVLDVLQQGKFFSTTGEVLIPAFRINGKGSGETVHLDNTGNAQVIFNVQWTFPLSFAEIISGDGQQVYRERIELNTTRAFGKQAIQHSMKLAGRKWARLEIWDIAANGAFTQTIWLD